MSRFFTISFLFVFNLLIGETISAQTWVKSFYATTSYAAISLQIFDSTQAGVYDLSISSNNTIFALMKVDQSKNEKLCAIDTSGNVKWSIGVGYKYAIHGQQAFDLEVTPDNGCIYYTTYMGTGTNYQDVYRLNANGAIIWTKNYNNFALSDGVYNIYQSINKTILQFQDSIVEVDSVGSFVQQRPFTFYKRMESLPDGDILILDSLSVNFTKESFAGTIHWTLPANGYNYAGSNNDVIYFSSGNSIRKVDISSGNIIWNKPINSDKFAITSDYGFITIDSIDFNRYDSSGTIQWTKTHQFPHFGYKVLAESPNKSIIAGGNWKFINIHYNAAEDFFPLLMQLDSLGNGVIDSTHYFFVGNANDNNLISFGDDAVYIAAAMGKTGIPRDTSLCHMWSGQNVFGEDWVGRFACSPNLNYKYSDLTGDGNIDTNDIAVLHSYYAGIPTGSRPHYQRLSNVLSGPDLRFAFENDSLNFSDTIIVHVILGSTSFPVDSIYGLSFNLWFNNFSAGITYPSPYIIHPNSLGDTSSNLYCNIYIGNASGSPWGVLCRNDHMNAYVAGDTLVTLYYAYSSAFYVNPITIRSNFSAITESGCPVVLNAISDTLYLFGGLGINNIPENDISIYPNPTGDKIFISSKSNIEKVYLMDETGRLLKSISHPCNNCSIDVSDLPEGFYFVNFSSEGFISRKKISVIH